MEASSALCLERTLTSASPIQQLLAFHRCTSTLVLLWYVGDPAQLPPTPSIVTGLVNARLDRYPMRFVPSIRL